MKHKKSFFERLTGSSDVDEFEEKAVKVSERENWIEEDNEEGQLTIDVYQTPDDIIIKSIVAGVRPEDLDIEMTREMITIRGKREDSMRVERENFFYQELYWGRFARSILLPQEINPEEAEATLKDGILTVKLPKINKEKVQKIKVKKE